MYLSGEVTVFPKLLLIIFSSCLDAALFNTVPGDSVVKNIDISISIDTEISERYQY